MTLPYQREDANRSGAEAIAAVLVDKGVETVFSLCGNHLLPLYKALVDCEIQIVGMRSEAAAVFAADGFARSSRKLGVAIVTGGPGFTNGLTGLATAHTSGSPVLLISGAASLAGRGRGEHQELDQVQAALPYTKVAREASLYANVGAELAEIIESLMTFPTGSGSFSVPLDVMTSFVEENETISRGLTMADLQSDRYIQPSGTALAAIKKSRKPVMILGQGGYWERAEADAVEACRRLSIPLFTMDVARGSVTEDGKMCFGYPDSALRPYGRLLREADVVILLGRGLDNRLVVGKSLSQDAVILEVGANENLPWFRAPNLIRIQSSVAAFLDALSGECEHDVMDERQQWIGEIARGYSEWIGLRSSEPQINRAEQGEFEPREVAESIDRSIGSDTCVALDAGDFVQWCRAILSPRGSGTWLRGGRMSTCGSALPMAVGAAVALNRPVVAIVGDGSLGYHVSEFETISRLGLPVICVVGNNCAWGLEYNLQVSLYGEEYVVASQLGKVDFVAMGNAMGVQSRRAADIKELEEVVAAAVSAATPSLIEVWVSLTPSPLTQAVIENDGRV